MTKDLLLKSDVVCLILISMTFFDVCLATKYTGKKTGITRSSTEVNKCYSKESRVDQENSKKAMKIFIKLYELGNRIVWLPEILMSHLQSKGMLMM